MGKNNGILMETGKYDGLLGSKILVLVVVDHCSS